jgi:hypothetical protein
MFSNRFAFSPVSKKELTLRLALYCLAGLVLFSFGCFLWFLYARFYLTLTQAEEIVILKSQLSVNSLNVDLLRKVQSAEEIRSKKILTNWEAIKNPFLPQ